MIALKVHAPERFGRIRMQRIPDASGDSFIPFVRNNFKSVSVVITESWKGYNMIEKFGYIHKKINFQQCIPPAHVDLPVVHKVASLLKRYYLARTR